MTAITDAALKPFLGTKRVLFSGPPLHRWRETGAVPPFPLSGTRRIKRRRDREASEVVEIGIAERSKGGNMQVKWFCCRVGASLINTFAPPAVVLPHHCLLTSLLRSSRSKDVPQHFWLLFHSKKAPLCRIAGNDCNATRRLHIKTPANNSGGNCLSLRV